MHKKIDCNSERGVVMSSKIELDKYYTPSTIAEYCYKKTLEILGKENISDIIEPSAGSGVFLDIIGDDFVVHSYDIAPEDSRIKEQNYLELDLSYKSNRLILGNPPYGRCLSLAQKFYKKSLELGDYIAFILPISQLNTNRTFYEFDLIYSEDLGLADYSGVNLHCVFNIYKRPMLGLNKKPKSKLNAIKIYRQDKKGYDEIDYDVRMCYWGNATAGKILYGDEKYAGEYKIKVESLENKDEIIEFIKKYDWNNYISGIAMKRLKQFHIIEVLSDAFPDLT